MALRYIRQVCSCEHTQADSCARDSLKKDDATARRKGIKLKKGKKI